MFLKQNFFKSEDTVKVAKSLLGKYLCRRIGRKVLKFKITEVEAYDGFNDKASHTYKGKTKRNKIMFGEAGIWYVYFTYGMHWMLNIVSGPKNYPAAVLIRGIEFFCRSINGPARLTKFLKIDKRLNGKLANKKSGLWIESGSRTQVTIKSLPRIGVDYAGKIWANKKLRFQLIKN